MNHSAFTPFRVTKSVEGQRDCYKFAFDDSFGWAIFTINDITGELIVSTSLGSCAYVDPDVLYYKHTNKPLTYFLKKCDNPELIAGKLLAFLSCSQYSPKLTKIACKKYILDARRNLIVDKNLARKLYDAISSIDFSTHTSCVLGLSNSKLVDLIGPKLNVKFNQFSCIAHENSFEYEVLSKALLPLFFKYLKENVVT